MQVYRAEAVDPVTGARRPVAVKVQRRPVARFLDLDLATADAYYKLLAWLLPGLQLQWLAEESRRHLHEELDFVAEAENARLAAQALGGAMRVPAVWSHLSTRRVLVMDWVDGLPFDALTTAPAPARAQAATTLQRAFNDMIFRRGFVHCDPHPGNILVDPTTGALTLLDHGVYRRLSPRVRAAYCRLWRGLVRGDRREMEDATELLGVPRRFWRWVAVIVAIAPGNVHEDGQGEQRFRCDAPRRRPLATSPRSPLCAT